MPETDFRSFLPVNTEAIYDVDTNPDPSTTGLVAHNRDATLDDTNLSKRITAITSDTVTALDVSLHDPLGRPFSAENPLYVNVTNGTGGDEVLAYHEFEDLAKNTPTSWSYDVTPDKVLNLQKVLVSGSGSFKAVVAIGTTLSELTKIVLFNSTANPVAQYDFSMPQFLDDTQSVKITVTNRDNLAQSIYTTLEGVEADAP